MGITPSPISRRDYMALSVLKMVLEMKAKESNFTSAVNGPTYLSEKAVALADATIRELDRTSPQS